MQVQSVEELPRSHPIRRQFDTLRRQVAKAESAKKRQRSKSPLEWQRWMNTFLRVLRTSGGNASAAIRAVPVARSTVYDYKNRCREFEKAWDAVKKKSGK